MHTVTLNSGLEANGVEMPILGFGVYQIPPEETEDAVRAALSAGYRSVDTAAAYQNEEAVGRAIKKSGIDRDDLFITTKLWIQDNGDKSTRKAFEKSLHNLGLEYVDLYLIHQPLGDYYGEWRTMEKLQQEGRVRAIGVSNFHDDRLIDLILHNEVTPAVNQIETHPFYQRNEEHEFMRKHGVQHEAWGQFAEGKNNLFTNPTLVSIGESHNKTAGQVVLRWMIQRQVVVIPKTVRPERMAENLDVFDFVLTEEEMAAIAAMDTNQTLFFDHRDPKMVAVLGGRRPD